MARAGDRSPAAELGLLDATMVGIGAMIGAGIFVLTGLAVEIAGAAALLVFLLNGVVTTFSAFSYAELSSALPRNGGGYAYVREAFPDPVSFVMGWTRWFTYMSAGALYALGFASNFIEFVHLYWPGLPTGPLFVGGPDWSVVYALAIVAVFVVLNALSTKASGGAETIVTVAKILILVVFVGFGLGAVRMEAFTPFFPREMGAFALLPAMGLTFIAFQGYDLIATVTEEVKNPRVNIPRAIFISLGVTVLIYLLVVWVALGTMGPDQLGGAGETAIAQAAGTFMPELPLLGPAAGLIAFGAVFSTISALNAVVIGSSRVAFAMGRAHQLPEQMGKIHQRYGTPFLSILISGAIMLVSVLIVPIETVGNLASLFTLLGFMIVNLSVIELRRTRPDLNRPFEVPFYPAVPILGILLNGVLAYFLLRENPVTLFIGAGWIALGGGVYVLLDRWMSLDQTSASSHE